MAETRHIEHIEGTETPDDLPTNLDNLQIGITSDNIEDDNANDLGYRALVFKDGAGTYRQCAAIDEDATFATLRVETALIVNATASFQDSTFEIYDQGDPTRIVQFECSAITAGNTRIMTIPDKDGTILVEIVEDLSPEWGGDMTSLGYDIDIPDNTADAFTVKEATNAYLTFNTTDGGERIHMHKDLYTENNDIYFPDGQANALNFSSDAPTGYLGFNSSTVRITIGVDFDMVGASGNDILIIDNQANSLRIVESTNPYLVFDTTNGAEQVEIFQDLNLQGNDILVPNNSAGATQILTSSGGDEYFRVVSTTAAEAVLIGGGDIQSGNYSKFEADGTLEFIGDATVWNDINVGTLQLGSGVNKPDTVEVVATGGAATGIFTLGYGVNEEVSSSLELMHDYKEGSNIFPHVHWSGNDAPTGTDKVKWQIEYSVCSVDTVVPVATTVVFETDYDTQYESKRSDFAGIAGNGFIIGDQFMFTLSRIAASADEYAGDALTQTIGIHYQIDTVGSRLITTK